MEIMATQEIERLMGIHPFRPDPMLTATLTRGLLAGELEQVDQEELTEAGYIYWSESENINYPTPDCLAYFKEHCPEVVDEINIRNEVEDTATEEARWAVERGLLEIVDGRYRLTARGMEKDGHLILYSLRRPDVPCLAIATRFHNCSVGKEREANNVLSFSDWKRARKRIIDELPDDQKRELGLPVKSRKPLNEAEELLLDMVLMAALAEAKKGA